MMMISFVRTTPLFPFLVTSTSRMTHQQILLIHPLILLFVTSITYSNTKTMMTLSATTWLGRLLKNDMPNNNNSMTSSNVMTTTHCFPRRPISANYFSHHAALSLTKKIRSQLSYNTMPTDHQTFLPLRHGTECFTKI